MNKTIDQKIWANVDKIQSSLNLSDAQLANFFKMTDRDFEKSKSRRSSIKIANLESLVSALNLPLTALITGEMDLAASYRQLNGGGDTFPDKYQKAKFSKIRTLTNFIKYIDFKHGELRRNAILRKLQLHESMFVDPDRLTNIHLITDLCQELQQLGFDGQDLFNIGLFSYHTNKNTTFGNYMSSFESLEEMFVRFLSERTEAFDRNFHYTIKSFKDNLLLVEARMTKLAIDHFQTKRPIGSDLVCRVKMGVFGSFSSYQGAGNSSVKKLKCMYSGGQSTIYQLQFASLQKKFVQ